MAGKDMEQRWYIQGLQLSIKRGETDILPHTLSQQEEYVRITTPVVQQVMVTVVVMIDVLLLLRAAATRVQDQVEIAIRVQHPAIQAAAILGRHQQVRVAVVLRTAIVIPALLVELEEDS